tara:strand:+ start:187 stop:1275 length:1089 start_codon:yes stop_codon:yes gene_type:complete
MSGKSFVYKAIEVGYLNGNITATIEDIKFFDTRIITSEKKEPWPIAEDYNQKKLDENFRLRLEKNESIALTVIQNDSLIYEEYWGIGSRTSRTNSFSMGKSVVSILIGVAIDEGFIENIDQKMIDFLPEYDREGQHFNKEVTIKHLVTMSSGIDWDEDYYNPLGITANAYFTSKLNELMFSVDFTEEPGKFYKYKSGNTQILAMILERATKKKLSEYTSEKLWKPLGAQSDAEWMLDKKGGIEKAYCCLNSNALDFSRIGQLYMDQGSWKGHQLVDSSYVKNSLKADLETFYGYSWWLYGTEYKYPVFCMRGVNGQYVISVPQLNLVATRLGHKKDSYDSESLTDMEFYIEQIIKHFDKTNV